MWLYGFDMVECYTNGDATLSESERQRAPVRAVVLPQMYDLAKRYNLPELMKRIEGFLNTRTYPYDGSFEMWCWPMAQYLWTNLDSAARLRPILLDAYRKHSMQFSNEDNKSRMSRHLRDCPELAVELLMSGGLDGRGLKLF